MLTYENISFTEYKIKIAKQDHHLIDVRTEAEFNEESIPTAQNIPLHLLPIRISGLAKKPIVFYCRSGARSSMACQFTKNNYNFPDIFNLAGGVLELPPDWKTN